jgi:hypothetical protein
MPRIPSPRSDHDEREAMREIIEWMNRFVRKVVQAGCIVLVLALGGAIAFVVNLTFDTPVRIEGVAMNQATGQPVPNARILIRVYPFPTYFCRQRIYALEADEDGKFSMQATAPWRIYSVFIEASGPGDFYALARSSRWVHEGENAISLQLDALAAKQPPLTQTQWLTMHYAHFGGDGLFGAYRDEDFEFVGKRWDVLHPRQALQSWRQTPRSAGSGG